MKRHKISNLLKWKASKNRKPLLLRGARQIGKTWLIRELGKSFENFVEINLDETPELITYFEQHRGQPDQLIQKIQAYLNCRIKAKTTLFFIDEIQESKDALISLRYFKEKMPDLHVIAAGSLIEFALKDISFPVGRVDFMHLFPFSFTEYLEAANQKSFLEIIQNKPTTLDMPLHKKIMSEFKKYSLLGGMPTVIKTYLETNDYTEAQNIQQNLVANFRSDFNKYATRAEVQYIKLVFDSIPQQLGEKFIFNRASAETRSRDLQNGLNLLCDAGLAYKANHSSGNAVPLQAEIKENLFKSFFFDTGLCHRILGHRLNEHSLTDIYSNGGLCENIVAQEILSATDDHSSPNLFYWRREEKSAQAEVDLLIENDDKVLPIEIKKGSDGRKKSLGLFCAEKKSKQAVIVCDQPFKTELMNSKKTQLKYLPYYMLNHLK